MRSRGRRERRRWRSWRRGRRRRRGRLRSRRRRKRRRRRRYSRRMKRFTWVRTSWRSSSSSRKTKGIRRGIREVGRQWSSNSWLWIKINRKNWGNLSRRRRLRQLLLVNSRKIRRKNRMRRRKKYLYLSRQKRSRKNLVRERKKMMKPRKNRVRLRNPCKRIKRRRRRCSLSWKMRLLKRWVKRIRGGRRRPRKSRSLSRVSLRAMYARSSMGQEMNYLRISTRRGTLGLFEN